MKHFVSAAGIAIISLCSFQGKAQFTYKIKADSVKVTNDNCSAELIIENSTKNVSGYLFNAGNGRTRFQAEQDPTVASWIKNISQADIQNWNTASSFATNIDATYPRIMYQRSYRLKSDDNTTADNFTQGSTFSYAAGSPYSGPLISGGGLNGGYDLQLNGNYLNGNQLAFRVRNGDNNTWGNWNELLHTGNLNWLINNNQLFYNSSDWVYFQNNLQDQHHTTEHDGIAIGWNYDGGSAQAFYVNSYEMSSSDNDSKGATVFSNIDRTTGTKYDNVFIDHHGNISVRGDVAAGGNFLAQGGTVLVTSDIQAKENISDIQPALKSVLGFRTINFSYKAEKKTRPTHYGLIAQEVEKAFPSLVSTANIARQFKKDSSDYKAVDYIGIVALLVKSLQEEDQKVENDHQLIDTLQKEVADLKKKLGATINQ